MPLLERSKLEVTVDFDKQYFAIGESLSGVVRLSVSEACRARGATLSYTVKLMRGSQHAKTFHSVEYLLFGSHSGEPLDLTAGSFTYPFAIPVPSDVPPSLPRTTVGRGNDCCCKCCCKCCGDYELEVGIEHDVSVQVLIPHSPFDKTTVVRVPRVVSAVTRAMLQRDTKLSNFQGTHGLCCLGCCPCLSCCQSSEQGSFTLTSELSVVAMNESHHVPFRVQGNINSRFAVQLIRSTHFQIGKREMDAEDVVGAVEFAPICGEERGRMPLHALLNIPTVSTDALQVQYFLRVKLAYDSCCCPGLKTEDESRVPLSVFSMVVDAPPTAGFAHQQHERVVYAYSFPPAHMAGGFAPIAPISEGNLLMPVWGAPMNKYGATTAEGASNNADERIAKMV